MVGLPELGFGDGHETFLKAIWNDSPVGVEEQAAAFGHGAEARKGLGLGFREIVVDGR